MSRCIVQRTGGASFLFFINSFFQTVPQRNGYVRITMLNYTVRSTLCYIEIGNGSC